MFGLGTIEIIIIGVILALIFGSKKLVELAKGLGESTKELRKIGEDISGEIPEKPDTREKPEKKRGRKSEKN